MVARMTTGFSRMVENRNLLQKLSVGLRFIKLKQSITDQPESGTAVRSLRELQSHGQERLPEIAKLLPVHFVAGFICIALAAWIAHGYITHPQIFSQAYTQTCPGNHKTVADSACRQLSAAMVEQPVNKMPISASRAQAVPSQTTVVAQQNSSSLPVPKTCEEIALGAEAGLE